MPNLYADVGQFKRRYVENATLDASDETEILAILETVARAIDSYCDRHFFAEVATRVFDGNDRDLLHVPDLLAITTLKLDEDTDGTFEVTLTATDYWAIRRGHHDQDGLPKTAIRLNTAKGSRALFLDLPRLVQIVGSWGYTQVTENVGTTNEALDTTETDIDLPAGEGTDYAEGQTILIDSEQMYVTAVTGDRLTVTRAANGTTAATHNTATQIKRYTYVPQVVEATLIQAGRLWKRRDTAYSTIIQNPGLGTLEVFKGLDPDVRQLLSPLRRIPV